MFKEEIYFFTSPRPILGSFVGWALASDGNILVSKTLKSKGDLIRNLVQDPKLTKIWQSYFVNPVTMKIVTAEDRDSDPGFKLALSRHVDVMTSYAKRKKLVVV